jgi:hypothetical protein
MFAGIHRSPIFIGVILVTVGLQLVIMMTPMGTFFKVIPISGLEWAISVGVGLGAVLVSFLTRLITRLACGPSHGGGAAAAAGRRRKAPASRGRAAGEAELVVAAAGGDGAASNGRKAAGAAVAPGGEDAV